MVVKYAVALHLVFTPLSVIAATILIEELALAVPHTIELVAFVPAAHLEVLLHKTRLQLKLTVVPDLGSAG